jgi:hypothetical protein
MDNKQEKFVTFVNKLCQDEKYLLTTIAQLHDKYKQYDEVLAYLGAGLKQDTIYSPLAPDVFVQAKM